MMRSNFKNALYNSFGFGFPILVALFTTPYIVHKLTPAIYGVYVLCTALIGFVTFLGFGFGKGIVKFVSHCEAKGDYDKINKIIGVSLLLFLVMGSLGCLVIYSLSDFLARDVFHVTGDYVSTASLAFKIAAFGFLANFITGIFSNVPKALQRYDVSVKIENGIWFCSISMTVILLYMGEGLTEILLSYIFFQLVALVIYYRASKVLLPQLSISLKFDRKIFREIFSFSAFTVVNDVAENVFFKADKIIIGAFLGTEAVAYYQIPFMIVQMANSFINSVGQFLFPAVSYLNSLGNREKLKDIYTKSTRYFITFALVINAGLILLGDTFLSLWMGEEFAGKSAFVIPIISLVFFFISISVLKSFFYNGLGKADVNMYSTLVSAACYLFACSYLIPKLRLLGAAIAFAFVLVPLPVYYYILIRLVGVEVKWFVGILAKSVLVLGLAVGIHYVISIPAQVVWFIGVGFMLVTFSVLMSYFLEIICLEDFLEVRKRLRLGATKT